MKRSFTPTILALGLLALLAACGGGGGGGGEVSPNGVYKLTVYEADGTTPVAGARVAVFNADNIFVAVKETSVTGLVSYTLHYGVYTARVQAAGFEPSPPQGTGSVPFTVVRAATHSASVNLDALAAPATVAVIRGNADTAGALIVAESTSAPGVASSGFTDSDGNYVLFNVVPGDYTVTAFKAGFVSTTALQTVAALDNVTVNLDVTAQSSLATVSGSLTFLAAQNGVIDITLRHPVTLDTIPGLNTTNSSTTYALARVPPGDYLIWATFANDDYVMDPDWINKNGGYPEALEVSVAGTNLDFDLSITDAVILASPTNTAAVVVPAVVDTLTPDFQWTAYPQTKQYVVEVFDLEGNSIWGGYDFDMLTNNATPRHPLIGTATSATYNFDASAAQDLADGGIYLWRVYAFRDGTGSEPGIDYVAISSSEEQMGLFRVALPPP